MANGIAAKSPASSSARRMTMQKLMRRRSTTALALALPLIVLILTLVIYPAFYAVKSAICKACTLISISASHAT